MMSMNFHKFLVEIYKERYKRITRKIQYALQDTERTLSGKEDDPKQPIWERRKRRLWNFGVWDVTDPTKPPSFSHMPTAVKILRWVLEILEEEKLDEKEEASEG